MTTTTAPATTARTRLSGCCTRHDGPHLHGCVVPRAADGRNHPGMCLLRRENR